MTIYFAWTEREERFSPHTHARQDIPIFYLSIQQKENGFAFARLHIPFIKLPEKKHAFISYRNANNKVVLLFKGRLWETPTTFNGQILKLELTAQPEDTEKALQTLHETLQQTPYWDPLFVPAHKRQLPSQHLESRSVLYCWSRITHDLNLSDIFQGRYVKNIGTGIWDETLTIAACATPLSHVNVYVEANWTQHHSGMIDVGTFLKSRLSHGMVSSFTGKDLQQRWPLLGKSFHNSGYTIVHSHLKEIEVSKTRSLTIYPTTSPGLKERHGAQIKDVYVKRFWFKPELIVAWAYRQRRKETIKITLKNSVQQVQQNAQKHKDVFIKLENLCADRPVQQWQPDHRYALFDLVEYGAQVYRCQQSGVTQCPPSAAWVLEEHPIGLKNPGQSSFFLTDRGYKAVAHAVDRARAYLANSSRCIKITFKTHWEILENICLDHTLTIEDSRLPGGTATGKVVEYQFVAEGQKRWVHVVLLCAVGAPVAAQSVASASPIDEEYLQPEIAPVTPCGIAFPRFDAQSPKEGVLAPWALKINDLVRQTTIENTADHQLAALQTMEAPTSVARELKKIPTKLRLPLKPLVTQYCLEHTIDLDIPTPWAPPCQIQLKRN